MSLLSARHLTHYFTGLRAVSDFTLELEQGELVALIGPNGAGKTTVFNLLTGVYRPTEGRIFFHDRDVTGWAPHALVGAGIARTFQNIRLFRQLSVLDNMLIAQYDHSDYGILRSLLRLPRFLRAEYRVERRARQLLEAFDLEPFADQPASSLPYGQQRRLEIARALATQPQVLLLDEPAAGMNPAEAEELMHLLLHLHQTTSLTMLLIEHQMQVVMGAAQRIKVLDFGETIAAGTPAEIRANPRVIEAYLGEEAPA
jgi:branched-chain amino acid transport system ATP-binding protein